MRPYRSQALLHRLPQRASCLHLNNPWRTLRPFTTTRNRNHKALSIPSQTYFQGKSTRFDHFKADTEENASTLPRNPLNYLEFERRVSRRNQALKKRIFIGCAVLAVCVALQVWIVSTIEDPEANGSKEGNARNTSTNKERLDALPNTPGVGSPVVVREKPGVPDVKLDAAGIELVETGTTTIPHFPRQIHLPSSSASPAATPLSSTPGEGAEVGQEQYTLLGLGVRSVSFLSIQVYVLGLYVRTSDLDKLQAAFVKHANPNGSSLIPSEKQSLKNELMSPDISLEIWDKILRDTKVRSAVRIVPTRGTDFNHLRDGWVRGITGRTQELSRKGDRGWEDESFGQAMADFKSMLSGRGKAPKGSTVLLTRDESGVLGLMYESELRQLNKGGEAPGIFQQGKQTLGRLADERISRQVWLLYLGGKNVSSEGARKSIVDGVMELVERPVGTVAAQVI